MRKDSFHVHHPVDLEEALKKWNESTFDPVFLAGGTDWVLKWRQGEIDPLVVIDISHVKELKGIREEEDRIVLGAATTFDELSLHPLLNKYAMVLVQAAKSVGSTQIRNMATIGGNVANAAPCADSVTALIALDAKACIINQEKRIREAFIKDLVQDKHQDRLREKELIIEIFFEKEAVMTFNGFAKIGDRSTVTISKLNAGIALKCENGLIKKAQIALGALAPKAFVAEGLSHALVGKRMDGRLISFLQEEAVTIVDQSIKGRKSHPYKREAVKGLMDDLIANLVEVKADEI
ncbi:FAD binding domain-containing protein [Tindallia californiensis]|uniref:Carbon-monoxide dehydrogenase medium subunit n=1 Tax=Tindallia californiensis TaxID=159292 RepID=A0A1H3MHU2_9FIRM|nr:FAD binding domain-containing protein [Tindallia californiensis]SDY75918.1 carbon-monoxide dehydrogenase medium subunit [Tindallia californiensis]